MPVVQLGHLATPHPTMSKTNYLPGGLIICAFTAMIYYVAHDRLELPELYFLSLGFVWGIWIVLMSLFRLDAGGTIYWLAGAALSVGFAGFAFVVAWRYKEGWSGIRFIPAAWNQAIPRILFAFGGLLALLSAVVFLSKARDRFRKGDDDVA